MTKNIVSEAIEYPHQNIKYLKELTIVAKKNRHFPTEAEKLIWQEVLRYKKTGYKFSRQKPIFKYVLDFYCSELSLAIEIDGNSHLSKIKFDNFRDHYLSLIGIETIRFTNEEILLNINGVKGKILDICSRLALSRGGARRAEGLK
ncbi:MAG TPA: endonuclease domain-containing protein [Candidatus Woesebacteria bacterium]|nr:endonuclease domain-containing protein [Candidatus Woesebacteria bacterium]